MDANSLKLQATEANNSLSDLQTAAPGMLNQLKQNLVGIFAKDNPIMSARGTALEDYLNTGNNSRVSTLPVNLPMVEGSNLTLSPTQQNAITTARSNAALVPLVGLNEIIKGQYGTIGDIIQGAGTSYNATIDAAKTRTSNLIDLYKTAVAEEEARKKAASSGGLGLDLASIIAAISQTLGVSTKNNTARPPLSAFDEPDTPTSNDWSRTSKSLEEILNPGSAPLKIGNVTIPSVPSNPNAKLPGSSNPLSALSSLLKGFKSSTPALTSSYTANPGGLSIAGSQPSLFSQLGIRF